MKYVTEKVLTHEQIQWLEEKLSQESLLPISLHYSLNTNHMVYTVINKNLYRIKAPYSFIVNKDGHVDATSYNLDTKVFSLVIDCEKESKISLMDKLNKLKKRKQWEESSREINDMYNRLDSLFCNLTSDEYRQLDNALQAEDRYEFNRLLAIANSRYKKRKD